MVVSWNIFKGKITALMFHFCCWCCWCHACNGTFQEKGKNLLLLTGPAGCGKTSTVKVLCRHHNIDIREWTNPSTYTTNFEKGIAALIFADLCIQIVVCQANGTFIRRKHSKSRNNFLDLFLGETFGMQQESQISLFRHFLLRANKYSSLLNGFKSSKRIVLIKVFKRSSCFICFFLWSVFGFQVITQQICLRYQDEGFRKCRYIGWAKNTMLKYKIY